MMYFKSVGYDDVVKTSVLMKPARFFDDGKTDGNHFTAAADCWSFPRLSHEGIIISACVLDRAIVEPFGRLIKQRRNAFYDEHTNLYSTESARVLDSMQDICVAIGCCAHDMSNALRWGLSRYAKDGALKDVFLFCEMLRDAFKYIHVIMISWLPLQIAFDRIDIDDELEAFVWRSVGVDADYIDEMVKVAPLWRNGSLHCRKSLELCDDAVGLVAHMFSYIMRFRKFTETRWLTIGTSSRAVLRASVVGLRNLLQHASDDKNVSQYHIHHHRRFNHDVGLYIASAALASFPAETFLAAIIRDDRLAKNIDALEREFLDELELLERMPLWSWARIADSFENMTAHDLRSATLHISHVTAAYVYRKSFKPAKTWPWRLARGDIRQNPEALRGLLEAPADDAATVQIKEMLDAGSILSCLQT